MNLDFKMGGIQRDEKKSLQSKKEKIQDDFGRKRDSLVEEVLAARPENIAPNHVTRWCNRKIDEVLKNHFDSNADNSDLKHSIKQEVLFEVRKDDFEKLINIIKEEKPERISPKWFREKSLALLNYIERRFKTLDGKVDWPFILEKMKINPDKFDYQENFELSEREVLEKLKKLLEKENPKKFNQNWIFRHDRKLYSQIYRNYRHPESLSWFPFIYKLGSEWIDRWTEGVENRVYNKKAEERIPKNFYEDEKSINDILEKHKEKLHLFISAENKWQFKKRNDICLSFIKEAQKGNILAEKELIKNINIVTEKWIQNYDYFKIYEYHREEMEEVIRKCIYYFDVENSNSFFVSYLYTSLSKFAMRLEFPDELSLDDRYFGSKYEMHDRVS